MDEAVTFEWDEHNTSHLLRHEVTRDEAESVFEQPRVEESQIVNGEERVWALGVTRDGRYLTVVYTLREGLIRVVTAHTAKRKYRSLYEKAIG